MRGSTYLNSIAGLAVLGVLGACEATSGAADGVSTEGDVTTADAAATTSPGSGEQTSNGPTSAGQTDGSGDAGSSGGDTADIPDDDAGGELRAFPGAEGWGTETPGGRGGRVMVVDTLSWDGPGSLSEALFTPQPRIIVFAVSGVIEVPTGVPSLGEEHSHLTIAGQTSPGGITLLGGGTPLTAYHTGFHDMVVRFVRFRGETSYDNISFAGSHHLVFDHCDFSGGTDETFDITYGHDYTISWSTITNSGPDGQRYGALLAYAPTTRISWHHNLGAHHAGRCGAHLHWAGDGGMSDDGGLVDVRNNVFYNCGFEQIFRVTSPEVGDLGFNIVGNTAIAGPSTPSSDSIALFSLGSHPAYEADNTYQGSPIFHPWSDPQLQDNPLEMAPVTTSDAQTAYDEVLALAGAWPRDPMNERTITEVREGTGTLGVVGDPLIEDGSPAPEDTDRDGMPDAWETERGLDPSIDDSAADDDDDGWTNVEEYLHARAQMLLGA